MFSRGEPAFILKIRVHDMLMFTFGRISKTKMASICTLAKCDKIQFDRMFLFQVVSLFAH